MARSTYDIHKGRNLGYSTPDGAVCDDCAESEIFLLEADPTTVTKREDVWTPYVCISCVKSFFRGYLQIN